MKKNAVIKASDWNYYSVPVKLSLLNRQKRIKYIKDELEKRHPLYSENTFFTSRFSVKKGKLSAEVAVIEKEKLQAYEKKFTGKKLLFENSRMFYKKKKKKNAFLFSAFLVSLLVFVPFLVSKKNTETEQSVFKEKVMNTENLPVVEEICDLIFQRVYEKKGKIKSLVWKNNECRMSVEDCHPEDIVFDKPCAVSYRNGIPYFTSVFKVQKLQTEKSDMNALVTEFHKEIRQLLYESKSSVQFEQLEENRTEFKFTVSFENFPRLLESIENTTDQNGWHLAAYSQESAITGMFVNCVFEKGIAAENSLLYLTASYKDLFKEDEPLRLDVQPKPLISSDSAASLKKEKIGEIRKADGSVFVYYKLNDGRINVEKRGGF